MKLRIIGAVVALAAASGCSSDSPAKSDAPTSPAVSTPPFTPTGELVYVTLPANRNPDAVILPVLHTIKADGTAATTLPLKGMGATWSHDGRHLLVNGVPLGTQDVLPWRPAVAGPLGTGVKTYRLPGMPNEINNCRATADEKFLVCDIAPGVVRIDLSTFRTTLLSQGGENQVWDISADGQVAFARQASASDGVEDAQLYTINIDGTGRRLLTDFGKVEGAYDKAGGAWLPDGSAIVTGTPDGKLVRVDASSGKLTEIKLDKDLFASRPSVSADGTTIAFEARGNGQDIYVTPVGGGPAALVAGTPDDELRPQWRPRGGMMS